ncbi:Eukaryotic translation initiation factor 4B [Papilio xuthus]|uniref:Eukaryotic translation initiation factor 4B n=1 Tax=Papilio xuthus TaxID=66420 RepID=A0A194Q4R5_PAPXU|nr:Eukaryotic translation initiation factor 4B [Papilio xuthus]
MLPSAAAPGPHNGKSRLGVRIGPVTRSNRRFGDRRASEYRTSKKSKKAKWVKANMGVIIAEPTTISTTNTWADPADEETGCFPHREGEGTRNLEQCLAYDVNTGVFDGGIGIVSIETSCSQQFEFNLRDDQAESYSYSSRSRAPVVLPSASRAARGGMAVDEESIPRRPPYIAHVSNLPYDVEESAIADLFEGLKITNLRLPREGGRLKGYGYVDFEDRESLVSAMNIEDLTVGGRRIRIEVSNNDNDRRMGRSGRSDRDRDYDPERTMGDWRSGPRAQPEPQARARPMERDRERDRERDSSVDNKPGGWRDGERQAPAEPARTLYGGRDSYGRDRYGEGGRDRAGGGGFGAREGGFRSDREGYGSRESRGFGGRGFGDRDRDALPREESKPRERPKLNLLPRTVPIESEVPTKPADGALDDKPDKPKSVPAEKVFGAAKPVDTAAKEREIEERLRKQEEEARRATEEKERWGRRDRGRDSRSYNRDRRDYSKDDRERRDYSKDDRERRDYSKEGRDRRDYSKDNKERRDSRERRDYSKEDRDRYDRDRERDTRDHRDDNRDYNDRDRRDYSRDRDKRDYSGERDDRPRNDRGRESSPEARKDRDNEDREREQNGRDRQSRSRDRHEDKEEKPLPKLKEQEKPNFVASNKFSYLEEAEDVALE